MTVTFCSVCRGFDCDLDNRCEECTDCPESDIIAYVKHRKFLKSKQSKPKSGADISLSPSLPSVPSSQPAPVFNVEARIALLSFELSASLASEVEGLGSQLQQSFSDLSNELSNQLTARISAIPNPSFSAHPEVSAPVRPGQAPSPHPPVSTAGMPQEFQDQGGVARDPQVNPTPSLSAKLHPASVQVLGEGA